MKTEEEKPSADALVSEPISPGEAKMLGEIFNLRQTLRHVRQGVHQAYHLDHPSLEPAQCRKGVCQAIAMALGEA
jgi:hypothetical protein